MAASEECLDPSTDEFLLETSPIQSPLQVFAGMGGLALIAERLPMLYPDVIQQVRLRPQPSKNRSEKWLSLKKTTWLCS